MRDELLLEDGTENKTEVEPFTLEQFESYLSENKMPGPFVDKLKHVMGKVEKIDARAGALEVQVTELKRHTKKRRRRTQARTCDAPSLAARTDTVMDACCTDTAGGGHRRTQASCDLPDACPSMRCASVFVPYMQDCEAMLARMPGIPLDDFVGFATSCDEKQASEMQPEVVQQFRVRVVTEGAAQSGAMFGGSGGSLPPLDPLQPILPAPAPASGESQAVVEHHAECSSADIASCVPACDAEHHGFELLATIDGSDTKMSCELHHERYSWVGSSVCAALLCFPAADF